MTSFMELLDKCRDQRLRYGNVAISKLPSSIWQKTSLLSLNQACSCGVYHGPHSAKELGNKAVVRTIGAGLLVRATCLAFLSAFPFPQAIVASPFLCPWQCITATYLGAHTTSSSSRIFCSHLILFPPKLMSLLYIRPHEHEWL
jgi:hypothetical protein